MWTSISTRSRDLENVLLKIVRFGMDIAVRLYPNMGELERDFYGLTQDSLTKKNTPIPDRTGRKRKKMKRLIHLLRLCTEKGGKILSKSRRMTKESHLSDGGADSLWTYSQDEKI